MHCMSNNKAICTDCCNLAYPEVGMLARKDVLCPLISVACLQVLLMLGIIILLTVSGIGLILLAIVITMFRIYQTFSWMKDLGVVWKRCSMAFRTPKPTPSCTYSDSTSHTKNSMLLTKLPQWFISFSCLFISFCSLPFILTR